MTNPTGDALTEALKDACNEAEKRLGGLRRDIDHETRNLEQLQATLDFLLGKASPP